MAEAGETLEPMKAQVRFQFHPAAHQPGDSQHVTDPPGISISSCTNVDLVVSDVRNETGDATSLLFYFHDIAFCTTEPENGCTWVAWGTGGRWQGLKAPSWEPAMKTEKERETVFVYEPEELQGLPDEEGDSRAAAAWASMQQLSPRSRPHLFHWAAATHRGLLPRMAHRSHDTETLIPLGLHSTSSLTTD